MNGSRKAPRPYEDAVGCTAADLNLLGEGGEPDPCLLTGAAVALRRAYGVPLADALRDVHDEAAHIRDFSSVLLAEDHETEAGVA